MSTLADADPAVLTDLNAAGYHPTTLDAAVEATAAMLGVNPDSARLILLAGDDLDADD